MKINIKKEAENILLTLIACAFGAVGIHSFVLQANFAPAGVDGIATMLYEKTGFNAGYYSIILNAPLLIGAWFLLKKRYVIYTIIFTAITSLFLIILEQVNMWQYITQTDRLISALFSGIMLGVRTGIMIKIGGSTGGADIIACMVQSKRPYGNIERGISIVCYAIMGVSYFVYWDLNCILLSIVQLIVFEKVMSIVLSSTRNATEVKIITKQPEQIRQEILYNFKHGGTVVQSKGLYTDEESSIVYSVINNRQLPDFVKMIKKYPDTFVYYSDVKGVHGNFRWMKDDIVK